MTEQAFVLLRKFYPPEGMFLKGVSDFSTSTSSIIGTFNVPKDAAYSIAQLDYVTAEQHVRCFSQLSYALMYLLNIHDRNATLYGTPADFEQLMLSGRMWYGEMKMRFPRSVAKGSDFNLGLKMTGIRKVGTYVVSRLKAHGPAEGDAEFIALL